MGPTRESRQLKVGHIQNGDINILVQFLIALTSMILGKTNQAFMAILSKKA